jgi:4-hydroxybenzoate polyprenyltransferase
MSEHKTYGEFLKNLFKLIRIFEWADKLQLNFIAAFILIAFLPHPERYLVQVLILAIYMLFLGSYGYVSNSYGDREQDVKVGKHLEVQFFSDWQLKMILTFFAIPSLLIPLYFRDVRIGILGIVTFLLITFYSLKPIRLKERGLYGIFTAALTQRTLPFLLFVFLVPIHNPFIAWFLLGWLSLIGIAVILPHQLFDYENDVKAGVETWVTRFGKEKAKQVVKAVVVLMILYVMTPVFVLPPYEGLAISIVTLAFTGHSIGYSVDALRSV